LLGKQALGNLKITGKKIIQYEYDPNYIDSSTGVLGFKPVK